MSRARRVGTLAVVLSGCVQHAAPHSIAVRDPAPCPTAGLPVATCGTNATLYNLNTRRGVRGLKRGVRNELLRHGAATIGVSSHVLRRDGVVKQIGEAAEQGTVWIEGAPWELFKPALNDESLARLGTVAGLEGVVFGTEAVSSAALVEFLRTQPTLRVVRVGGKAVTDEVLQVIGTLEELRVLSVHGDAVTDVGVAAIASLPHLESLDLSRTSVTSEGLAVLARTDTLRELTLDGVRNRGDELSLRGLAALADLPRFTSLRARHRSLDSVATLAALPHLTTLDLEHCAGLRDLQGLAGLKELRTLDLSNTDATDLRALERLTQLEELDLGGTYPSHRETLGRLQRLRRLALDHVHLSWDDIAPLRSLPQLEAISAYNSGLDCTGEDLLVCDFIHTW